ncbi:outer membrane protein transport protein [Enterovibrio paralichthyis]|uniref:outer membrane protein transport protein n=1 Tax=Enterovibrio paralichthyis TaxID=2853805 RepID=UPI001C464DA4|nr:outer membrane protein transport protein [Enterovibrio paralichthyis]MBV7298586.1 outer membrane protein transport protein [Enterovibrio paralichthyis]
MNKKRLFIRSAVALAVAASSTSAMAAGFQLNGQSATGLGRAFAGDAVIADNAAVMARNPAAMAMFDAPELSLGLIAIDTDVQVKDATYSYRKNLFQMSTPESIDTAQAGDISLVPNIFYVHPINDKFAVGAGIYSNFGTKTEFADNFPANELGGLTDVKSVNFALSGSYRINEQWSLGAGIDLIQGTGKLKRSGLDHLAKDPIIGGLVANSVGDNMLNIDAEGTGFGWNVGTVYELNEKHRFGLSYRHSPDIKASGDTMIFAGKQLDGDLVLRLPDIAEFSGYHLLTDKFAMHYSVQWIEWSTFDKLATSSGTVLNEYNWQDGMHYSIGGTYYLNNDWTLRAGYMYDTSAQDQKKSISVPDSDRQWFSAGFTYQATKNSTIDFGMTYLIGQDVEVKDTLSKEIGANELVLSTVEATTRANAWLYGIQYSYKF